MENYHVNDAEADFSQRATEDMLRSLECLRFYSSPELYIFIKLPLQILLSKLLNNLNSYTFDDNVHFVLTFDGFIVIISQKSIFTSYRLKSQKESIVLPV